MPVSSYFTNWAPGAPCDLCDTFAESHAVLTGDVGTYSSMLGSVLLSAGGFSFSRSLLSISSVGGVGWSFGLNYLSTTTVDGLIGKGFNFPQYMRLEEEADGDVVLVTSDNIRQTFEESAGVYTAAAENSTLAVLTRAGTGAGDEFTLTSNAGAVTKLYGFDAAISTPGRIKSVTDRFGSEQTYVWQSTGGVDQLTSVTDSYGRTIIYRTGARDSTIASKRLKTSWGASSISSTTATDT